MRRLTPLLLAVALAAALAACSSTSSEAEVKTTTPGTGTGSTAATAPTTTTDTSEPEEDFSGSTLTEPPTGPFPEPTPPPDPPTSASFTEKIVSDLTKAMVKLSGRSTSSSSGSCSPEINQAAPAGSYMCTVDFEGQSLDFSIMVTGDTSQINYNGGLVSDGPMSREKAEWEAARFAGGDQALCDMEDLATYALDTDAVFTCKATDSAGDVVELSAQLAKGGTEGARLSYTRS